MAKFALTDASLVLNSVDLSDHVKSIDLATSMAELQTTAMGASWTTIIGGLQSFALGVTFQQDFAANEVDATLWAAMTGTPVTAVVKPTSGAVASTNPSFTGSVLVNDYKPVTGSVGDLAEVSVNWPGSSTLTRATS